MKFKHTAILLFIFLLLATGCAKTEEKKEIVRESWPEELSYVYTDNAISGNREIHLLNGVMHLCDYTTGKRSALCTYPNCKHEPFSVSGSHSCEAVSPAGAFGDFEMVALHGDNVLQFCSTEGNPVHTEIYLSHVGKRGRRKVGSIPYVVDSADHMYLEGKYAYFIGDNGEVSESGFYTFGRRQALLQMDLDDFSIKELVNRDTRLRELKYNGQRFVCEKTTRNRKANSTDRDAYNVSLIIYDKETGKERELDDLHLTSTSCIGCYDGKVYYIAENEKSVCTYDIDTAETKTLYSVEKNEIISSGDLLEEAGIMIDISDKKTIGDWRSSDKRTIFYEFSSSNLYEMDYMWLCQYLPYYKVGDTVYGEYRDSLEDLDNVHSIYKHISYAEFLKEGAKIK